ncbi:transcription antiterminator BglG, partial [Streptococcus pyogenes]
EKTFVLQNNLQSTDVHEILKTVSQEELILVNQLIHRAEEVLESSFELSLYLAIGDHLHYTLERNRLGLPLQNPLSW